MILDGMIVSDEPGAELNLIVQFFSFEFEHEIIGDAPVWANN